MIPLVPWSGADVSLAVEDILKTLGEGQLSRPGNLDINRTVRSFEDDCWPVISNWTSRVFVSPKSKSKLVRIVAGM